MKRQWVRLKTNSYTSIRVKNILLNIKTSFIIEILYLKFHWSIIQLLDLCDSDFFLFAQITHTLTKLDELLCKVF